MELLFYCKIKGSLKLFVDVVYSITEFKRKVFVLSFKVLLPYNNNGSMRPRSLSWIGYLG